VKLRSPSVLVLGTGIGLLNYLVMGIAPVGAENKPIKPILRINELNQPATTVKEWLSQAPTLIRITGVKLNPTNAGLEVILETETGTTIKPVTRTEGNTLIAEISNATLALTEEPGFTANQPAVGVATVSVTQANAQTVRVRVVGTEAAPTASVKLSPSTPIAEKPTTSEEKMVDEGEEEIVATGQKEGGYVVPNSSVGTRTDTPLRDVPQAIQVIPQQVLKDQAANDITDVLRNIPGVTPSPNFGGLTVRGFSGTVLRDGLTQAQPFGFDIDYQSNVEQVELLRGPASVLYGAGTPGGSLNLTEKQPLAEPFYELGATVGNFDFYRGTVDLTGPLNPEKTILYRLNIDYENAGSFIDFVNRTDFAIFPVVSFQLGKNTKLTLDASYQRTTDSATANFGALPLEGTVLPNPLGKIPRSRFLGEPDFDDLKRTVWSIGSLFEHKFSENWSLRNRFRYNYAFAESRRLFAGGLRDDNRTLDRNADESQETAETYTLRTDVLGKFQTGIIKHDVLFGVELSRSISDENFAGGTEIFPIDIFNPEYGNFRNDSEVYSSSLFTSDTIGIYAQDLLSIGKNVKILLGGRFDWGFIKGEDRLTGESGTEPSTSGFAPRVGIVYQPIEPVSLYASWSRSFEPQSGQDRQGSLFVPITGDQFEVGVKTEFFDGKLSATLAAYQITRQNDFQPDPVDPDRFQIQVGEQQSRGIDFSLSGEPLPGLRLIAGYAYIDAKVTKDNTGLQGNLLTNVPQHSGNLWAVYEFQKGDLEGLGIGAGVSVLGARQNDIENTVELPTYALANALLYYKRDNWKVQLNFENLFDVEYFDGGNYGSPFSVKGTVSVTF
jgi:iron complex outermembrane recepter protein